jgi:hypothetical protein
VRGDELNDERLEALIKLSAEFPMRELMFVGDNLRKADVLVLDRPDPDFDVCSPIDHIGLSLLDRGAAVLLPDRNVVSRMAQLAKGQRIDSHGRNAAAILAFSQHLEIQIEPSIAFHELAFNEGNEAALGELGWFRTADSGSPAEWLAAAMGVADTIQTIGIPPPIEFVDLAKPLKRWRRNYVVALKMAELELNENLNAIKRVILLLEWMRDKFIVAGPAAMLAFLYFAPNSPPRRGLLKNLRSADRKVALNGLRNAAWDITYLSDFARRINEVGGTGRTRFVFATFDQRLRDLARFVVGEYEEVDSQDSLATSFQRWWSVADAQHIAALWAACISRTRSHEWWAKYKERPDYVGQLIAEYEAGIKSWNG